MKTKIISVIIILLILITSVNAKTIELSTNVIELKETNNYWELVELIDLYTSNREEAREIARLAREAGATEDSQIILNAQSQWFFNDSIIQFYQEQLNEVEAELNKLEYKNATLIWGFMKYLGWNDYVCAGILGNMMAEVGGGTLDLPHNIDGYGYYGLCQWSKFYTPDVYGQDLKGQLNFLKKDIKTQFDTYGFCYSYEFDFDAFLELENEQDAALAFMKCYERGLPHSNWARQQYATIAYDYFVK